MSRLGVIAFLACMAITALLWPASSLAGTYTWNLPANFTATSPGSNPDHDSYGAHPWSYVESQASLLPRSHDPSTFQQLSTFSSAIAGGLSGWTDPAHPNALIALNPTGSKIGNVPAGQLALAPSADRFVAVGWTSPLPSSATVQVTGSVTPDGTGLCAVAWSLDQNGLPLESSATSPAGSISVSPTVAAGGSIYLTVDYLGLQNPACDTAGVNLQIQATQTLTPTVSLDSPATGAVISNGQPTFSGFVTGFGASSQVKVRVYKGFSASGTPLQTLTTTRLGSGYSVGPSSALADGQYTAQAETDSLSAPPDSGLSPPVSFYVHNASPTITLNSLGSQPLRTATPTLTGSAGTGPGDASTIAVLVYPGSDTNATPVRLLTGPVGGGGGYAIRVTPGLADGRYTAVAAQRSNGTEGLSAPVTFTVKLHAPIVTLDQPADGTSTSDSRPLFSGHAGTSAGDSKAVDVFLYKGTSVGRRSIGRMHVPTQGSNWSGRLVFLLDPGLYTARAVQRDDAGHTGFSQPTTFQVLAGPSVVGPTVTLDRSGAASLRLACTAPTGQLCTGTVLITTLRNFQPVPGGPVGHLKVLFAYLSIPGGKFQSVRRAVNLQVARLLRRAAPLKVRVRVALSQSGGGAENFSTTRALHAA